MAVPPRIRFLYPDLSFPPGDNYSNTMCLEEKKLTFRYQRLLKLKSFHTVRRFRTVSMLKEYYLYICC